MKKVLSIIGGFFVKIGRWIANTAWVQPLLIVGAIFGIILSIPYIKRGIEGLQAASQYDTDIAYYKDRGISLTGAETGESDFDKLLTALENGNNGNSIYNYEYVTNKYGSQFFLTFAKENCSYCKECVDGYVKLSDEFNSWGLDGKFSHVTVMVDTQNDDDKYLAKYVFEAHQDFFDDIVGEFNEYEDYALLDNVSDSQKSTLKSSIEKLQNAVDENGEGLETPTTFMIDLTQKGEQAEVNVHGVTAIFFNYVDLLSAAGYTETNSYTKGKFLSDCWSYSKLFEKGWKKD